MFPALNLDVDCYGYVWLVLVHLLLNLLTETKMYELQICWLLRGPVTILTRVYAV